MGASPLMRSEFLPCSLRLRDLPWIPLAAALALGGSWLYIQALDSVLHLDPEVQDADTSFLLAVIILVPVVEEIVCRGVLHALLARVTTPNGVLVLASVLFAFLHGLNGASWFEFPHRFVAGLLLGLLRRHSGGLPSPIFAHALHNLAATWR
jgi:membrane protease YdiL (CAAX protease family)